MQRSGNLGSCFELLIQVRCAAPPLELVGRVVPVAPPLEGLCGAPPLEVFPGNQDWGAYVQICLLGGSIDMGGDRGGQVCVKTLLSLVFLVVKFGEWRCGGISI